MRCVLFRWEEFLTFAWRCLYIGLAEHSDGNTNFTRLLKANKLAMFAESFADFTRLPERIFCWPM